MTLEFTSLTSFTKIFIETLNTDKEKIYSRKPCRFCYKRLTKSNNAKIYNPGHNILELYNILVQIQFTTIKTKLNI